MKHIWNPNGIDCNRVRKTRVNILVRRWMTRTKYNRDYFPITEGNKISLIRNKVQMKTTRYFKNVWLTRCQ